MKFNGDKTDVTALVKYAQDLETEIERLRAALERLACRHVTEAPLWWQTEARAAIDNQQITEGK
jgi:hypothetical protein